MFDYLMLQKTVGYLSLRISDGIATIEGCITQIKRRQGDFFLM